MVEGKEGWTGGTTLGYEEEEEEDVGREGGKVEGWQMGRGEAGRGGGGGEGELTLGGRW